MDAIVFADVTDPWAYVGATRFERGAATFTIITGERTMLQYLTAPFLKSLQNAFIYD